VFTAQSLLDNPNLWTDKPPAGIGLTAREYETLLMLYGRGFNHHQLADMERVSHVAVGKRYRKAVAKLRAAGLPAPVRPIRHRRRYNRATAEPIDPRLIDAGWVGSDGLLHWRERGSKSAFVEFERQGRYDDDADDRDLAGTLLGYEVSDHRRSSLRYRVTTATLIVDEANEPPEDWMIDPTPGVCDWCDKPRHQWWRYCKKCGNYIRSELKYGRRMGERQRAFARRNKKLSRGRRGPSFLRAS
jgi:hypothetical protein